MVSVKALRYLLPLLFFYVEGVISQENEGESIITLPEVQVSEERVEEIYVEGEATTATKTYTPIDEIPRSVQVINRDVIDDQKAVRLQDVVYNASGVVPGDSFFLPSFLIRGLRAEILRDGFLNSTGLFLNVYQEELANVERVEILKGPTSVIYGNAGVGGIINVVTKKPLPYFYASAEGSVGSYEFYRGAVDVSTPLNDDKSLLFRINASYRNSESFRDFIYTERFLAAPVMTWCISPRMTLTLEGEFFFAEQPFDQGLVAVGDEVADIPLSRNLGEPDDRNVLKSYLGQATLGTEINEFISLRNAFRYYRSRAELFDYLSAALLEDNRTLIRFILDSVIKEEIITTRNDLSVSFRTWALDHTLLFGLEYMTEDVANPSQLLPASPLDIFDPVYGVEVDQEMPKLIRAGELNDLGVYVQDQINISDKIYLTAGLRYDYLDDTFEDNIFSMGSILRISEDERSEFGAALGLLFKPVEEASLYTNYSRSFNQYSVREFTIEGSILGPEKATQYEGGAKFDLWDGRLSSTLAVFSITKKDALRIDPINGLPFSVQVEEERSRGVEFDLAAQPFRGLNMIASYAFIDAEVREDDLFEEGNELAGVP